MADLFLSYSRKDQTFVRQLHKMLEENEREVWVDWENIPLTAEWLQEIYDGIEAANAFAYVISPDSVRSEVCSLELAHALSHNKRLIPILHRELVEDMDKHALDPNISSHNWIFFRDTDDFSKSFQTLKDALDTDLEYLRLHTRLLVRAVQWNDKERDASLVLRGNELRDASIWLDRSAEKQPEPTELHREYVHASQRASAARRRVVVLTSVYGLVVLVLAVFAFWQAVTAENRRQEAEEQRKVAEEQRDIADEQRVIANDNAATAVAAESTAVFNGTQAQSLALASSAQQLLYRDRYPELAVAVALEANKLEQPPALAQSALAQSAYFPGVRYIIPGAAGYVSQVDANSERLIGLSAAEDNALVMWDLTTGNEVQRWSPHPDKDLNALAFTPDGNYAAGSWGGLDDDAINVEIFDTTTYEQVSSFVSDSPMWRIIFTEDGTSLLSATEDSDIEIRDWRTGEIRSVFAEHENSTNGVDVSADGEWVLSGDQNGEVILWNLASGEIKTRFNVDAGQAWVTKFTPDGLNALVGYEDFSVRMFNLDDLSEIYRLRTHINRVWDIAVSADGKEAYSTSYDGTIIEWDLTTGQELVRFRGHNSTVYGVVIVNDTQLLSGSTDGTLRFWDGISGAELYRFEDYTRTVWSLDTVQAEDGTVYLLSAGDDGTAILWDTTHNVEIQRFTLPETRFMRAVLSPDLKMVLTGDRNGAVVLWDVATGQEIRRFLEADNPRINAVALSPDGQIAAAAGDNATIDLWNAVTGEVIGQLTGHDSRIWSIAFSPDGTQLASASVDRRVILWDVAEQNEIKRFEQHEGVVYRVLFTPDGQQLLSASQDRSLRLWDIASGKQVRRFEGHQADILGLAISPDGTLVASGADDRSVRLWDLQQGTEIQKFDGHTGEIFTMAFNPGGNSFYSGGTDTTIRQWQIQTLAELIEWTRVNRYTPEFTCEQRVAYQIEPLCEA